jgi:arsenate reductase
MARDRKGSTGDTGGEEEPVRIPLADVLDLHAFAPADVGSVVEEFLGEAARAGYRAVRLIHGKGMGIQRARVRALLASHPGVLTFRDAPGEGGGWGSTVALLDPAGFPPLSGEGDRLPGGGEGDGPVAPRSPRARRKILFLCTGNACRSQMAEGFTRVLKGDRLDPYSAGVHPYLVHPLAAKVMAEAGVDISPQYSKHVDDLAEVRFDWVVTLCDYADGACPTIPGAARRVHRPFDDPVRARGTDEQILSRFREVRDQIRAFVETLPESLGEKGEKE